MSLRHIVPAPVGSAAFAVKGEIGKSYCGKRIKSKGPILTDDKFCAPCVEKFIEENTKITIDYNTLAGAINAINQVVQIATESIGESDE